MIHSSGIFPSTQGEVFSPYLSKHHLYKFSKRCSAIALKEHGHLIPHCAENPHFEEKSVDNPTTYQQFMIMDFV
jgi:hypothetical protein